MLWAATRIACTLLELEGTTPGVPLLRTIGVRVRALGTICEVVVVFGFLVE